MATLTDITAPDPTTPNGWDTTAAGDMELIAAAVDTDFGSDGTNTTGTYDQGYVLDNVDSDLGNMDTLSIQLRYGLAKVADANLTWDTLDARIVNGATILAAADSGGTFATIASSITTTGWTNSSTYSFSTSGYLNTSANKSVWDGATVELRITKTRTKGGDAAQAMRVSALTVAGTYTAVVPVIYAPWATPHPYPIPLETGVSSY